MFRRQSSNVSSKLEESGELQYNYVKMDNASINGEMNSDGFIAVEGMYPAADEAANTLALCRKLIIPYDMLLVGIGWRKIQVDSCSTCIRVFNTLYPVFIFTMLVMASIAQIASCFSRTKDTITMEAGTRYHILQCKDHLITFDGISDVLLLLAYLLALYTFRVGEPEHLSSLAETVLLSFNDISINVRSRKKPLFILLAIFCAGVGFFIASTGISTLRLYALELNQNNTIIGWFTSNVTHEHQSEVLVMNMSLSDYNALRIVLVAISFIGFAFFDLLYIAVTINYCSQCQLLTFYIDNIQDKVKNKKYPDLKVAMTEIHKVDKYLKILNGNISVITSLIFMILIANAIRSYSSLIEPDQSTISIITGFLNTVQWSTAVIFPALAARMTASGNQLRRLGQEIAVRPFYYSGTPDLELKLFLNFTEYTRYEAYLAFIPMQPSLVLGFGYTILLLISSGIIISRVQSVVWF